MLFLVHPTGLKWVGAVGEETISFAREHGKDLGLVEGWWQPTEEIVMNADHVRSAIRWGMASERGIVVAVTRCVTQQRPRELEALIAESVPRMRAYRESEQVKMVDAYLETQVPGWTEHGRELDSEVELSLIETLQEAREEAAQELKASPVVPSLRAHWISLGGMIPDPE